jgi:predicted ATPase
VLRVDPDQLDLHRFERLALDGREALAAGRSRRAATILAQALALWRGPALADFAYESFAQPAIATLEELRLATIEDRLEADLACGRAAELVPELEGLVDEHPLRERLRGQLMLALYRSSRQAEALETYQRARQAFVEELGIDPGPELQALYKQVLRQDNSLKAPVGASGESRLPVSLSPLIGRARELEDLAVMLRRDDVRLLTLVGPGGTGKTRLAIAVAAAAEPDFAQGSAFVSLAALDDPTLVPSAIARGLGVQEVGAAELAETLGFALRNQELLLVLDNFEQVADAALAVAALLRAAPGLKILVTSRVPLRVGGEHQYPLPPLAEEDAASLFCVRARAVDPDFDLEGSATMVTEICERLDRLPLAIELAAARVRLLPPQALLDRLGRGLDLLRARGDEVPERQRTLRATINWSYGLLSERDAQVFRRLTVFAGSWTLDAAEVVCEEPGEDVLERLESLLDHSLLRRAQRDEDERRFVMLATIREYGRERLDATDEAEAVRLRHAEWYVALAEYAGARLRGAEEGHSLARLEREHDNLRAALTWAHESARTELLLRLCGALRGLWYMHNHVREGAHWLEIALAASAGQHSALRAHVLQGAATFAGMRGNLERAELLATESLALYRELGDRRGTAFLLRDCGVVAARRGDFTSATALYEESAALFRELDDAAALAIVISNLGDLALREGDFERATDLCRESLVLQRELGATFGMVISLNNLAFAALHENRVEDARVALEESLLIACDLGATESVGYALEGLAAVAGAHGDWERAGRVLGRAEAIRASTGSQLETAEQAVHERTLAVLRGGCSEQELVAAMFDGASLTDDEAIGLALASPSSPAA